MARRVAIGFNWQGEFDREQAFEAVREAEQAGVESVWVPEAWGRDAFSLLTQIADRTERIQLATGIVNIYSRTPAALAQHFATLDELSHGRVIIGLGNSGPNVIEHFHGVPFQPAFRRMRETVELLRLFFKHEPVQYAGQIFQLARGFALRFEPVRKEVPIYLATLNPTSVKMTAQIADGWLPMMIPLSHLAGEIAQVKRWVAEAGRDPAAFTVRAPGMVMVANSPEAETAARRVNASTIAFYCARMGEFYYQQLSRQGFRAEADAVRAAWKAGGAAAATEAVPRAMQDQLGFAGPTEACIERLEAQQSAGATLHPIAVLDRDPAERKRSLQRLAS
jgi:F420-dependent oxidoreductase-like protein